MAGITIFNLSTLVIVYIRDLTGQIQYFGLAQADWLDAERQTETVYMCEVGSLVRRKCNLSGDAILFVCDNTKFLTTRLEGSEFYTFAKKQQQLK